MIDTNEIVDKKFTETNGGYNKDEVDEFLDRICDDIEEQKKTAPAPQPQQKPEVAPIYDKSRVTFFEIVSGIMFFAGVFIAMAAAAAVDEILGSTRFSVFISAFIPWAIGSIISFGIAAILDALYKIHDKP